MRQIGCTYDQFWNSRLIHHLLPQYTNMRVKGVHGGASHEDEDYENLFAQLYVRASRLSLETSLCSDALRTKIKRLSRTRCGGAALCSPTVSPRFWRKLRPSIRVRPIFPCLDASTAGDPAIWMQAAAMRAMWKPPPEASVGLSEPFFRTLTSLCRLTLSSIRGKELVVWCVMQPPTDRFTIQTQICVTRRSDCSGFGTLP